MDFCSKEGSMNFSQNMIVPNNTTSSSDQLVKQDQSSSTSTSSSSSSSAQLKCPRCTSSNTKFCYYNNYNRSQPRHFCKSCKRHWTQGGTLRNVPVGGGRKNKRLKITKTAEATSYSNNNSSNSSSSSSSNSSEEQQPWLRQGGYKDSFFRPDFANYGLEDEENFVVFDPSLLSNLPSFFGNIPSSPSSSFTGQFKFPSVSDSSYSTITTATAIDDDPSIKLPETSSMDSLGYWSWDYLDTLISTDLKLPAWDDLQTQELGL